jgi:hypothetical protein
MNTPYQDPALNPLYDMLFCDDIELYRKHTAVMTEEPWRTLLDDQVNSEALHAIVDDAALPSRVRLLAAHRLRSMGETLSHTLLGVVVELGLEGGLDALAAYPDGTARYFNYSGRLLIWESHSTESDALIDKLMQSAQQIVSQIGLWNKPRRMFPPQDVLRISFLGTDGLYFGEGPINTMFGDPLAAPALQHATAIMQFLIARQEA